VRDVEREWSIFVFSNHKRRQVSKIIIRRVQVASGAGPNVGSIPVTPMRMVVETEHLKFSIM